ncbi:vinorine synthase-like [Lycium barbarum]|uniref:vinorine synthase-like n=1 Tax=Lycium barbarum TaxID=112863 RepID=UPI00293E0F4F|nr:vinorine synthase-like [Lycium barbarum]
MERKIEIVSMEFIRPLFHTPNHLKCFEYSFLDQTGIPLYAPLALFFPPPIDAGESYSYEQARSVNSSRLLVLKKSLSETLARFYPFAGRIKDNCSIECNDEGVPFYEAFALNYEFESVLRNPELSEDFLPSAVVEDGSLIFHNSTLYPLLVQVTIFKCGAMAICMGVFHQVADGATLYTLANAWGITARGSSCNDSSELVAAAKFLPPPIPYVSNVPNLQLEFTKFFCNEQRVAKLFTFDASTIASLKAKAVSDDVPKPTRVEAVSALIWKCVMVATNLGPSKLAHLVNIRKRFVPPLPNHCVGNAVAVATAACKGAENMDGSDLATLVTCIRKSLIELSSKYVEKHSRDEAILAIPYDFMELIPAQIRGEVGVQISSLCGYQFYDVDFGWGKPSWLTVNQKAMRDFVLLMDSRDSRGIDAWICLKDSNTMSVFKHELEQLLA